MKEKEIWAEHPIGVKVSNSGRVFVPKSGKHPEHYTIGSENNSTGYLMVRYQGKNYSVHRLVGDCHVPNPMNKPEIDHIDRNPKNNRADNIRWVERSENCKNRILPQNNTKSKPTIQFTKSGEFVKEWPSIMEIQRQLGFHNGYICNCCNGKYKSAYGFIWRYKEESD